VGAAEDRKPTERGDTKMKEQILVLAIAGLGTVEVFIVTGFIILSLGAFALLSQTASRPKRERSANGENTSIRERGQDVHENVAGSEVIVARATPAIGCPSGTYLRWPMPLFWILLLLGFGGAVAGGGKTADGFLTAFALNPIVWGAAYSFSQIGRIRCPHCRKSSPLKGAAKYPVGAAITCDHCGNDFAKPLG
jgi:hypothetical protein